MKGDSYSLKLPNNLAPGDYLIRHEIIALHLAVSKGGAEFYPSCTQVRVGGNANGKPDDTVTFPGGYSDNDPGIFVPGVSIVLLSHMGFSLLTRRHKVFDGNLKYVFPGPPISNLAASDGEITPPDTASASFPSASATATGRGGASGTQSPRVPDPSASAAPAGGSKSTCHLKKRSASEANINRPRHYSRIMARILHGSH